MRTIHVFDARSGMVVTKDIYNSDGKVLVAKGVKLTDRYIERLHDFEIRTIEVMEEADPPDGDAGRPLDPVSITKEDLELLINRAIRKLIRTNSSKTDLMLIVEDIFEVILEDSAVLELMFQMKTIGDRTFFHAVKVAVLSVATGIQLELDKPALVDLGKAALLFDVGKCYLDRELIRKSEEYSEKEKSTMSEHTITGYMLLRSTFSEDIASVALQHHERFDGSGYPRRLVNEQLHLFSRIVSVADVFVALKSARVYRPAYEPYEALEFVIGAGGHLFDSQVVNAFNEIVVAYPIGSVVQLNDGRAGIVSGIHRSFSQRPEVTLMFDRRMLPVKSEILDLSNHPTSFISRVLYD